MTDLAVHFTRTFAAAHRVWNDASKCQNIHGHNFEVDVTIQFGHDTERLEGLTDQNFITPFEAIKDVIDHFDHAIILDFDDPWFPAIFALPTMVAGVHGVPSTEFMADHLASEIVTAVADANPDARAFDVHVFVRETAGIQASASAAYGDDDE